MLRISLAKETLLAYHVGPGGHGVTVCSDKISQREMALQHRATPEAL